MAPPLELLWLGAVNLGAALPVHEALGTAAITGGAMLAGPRARRGASSPEVAILAVLALRAARARGSQGRPARRDAERAARASRAEAALADGHARRRGPLRTSTGSRSPFRDRRRARAARRRRSPLPSSPRSSARCPSAAAPLRLGFFAFAALACASGAKALRAREAPRLFFGALGAAVALALVVALSRRIAA